MRHVAAALMGAIVAGNLAGVAQGPVDVTKLGPQVGQVVPALRLEDHLGRTATLDSVAGPKGTMLVFFRSADW